MLDRIIKNLKMRLWGNPLKITPGSLEPIFQKLCHIYSFLRNLAYFDTFYQYITFKGPIGTLSGPKNQLYVKFK